MPFFPLQNLRVGTDRVGHLVKMMISVFLSDYLFLSGDLYTIKDYYVFFSLTEVIEVGVLFLIGSF